MTTTVSSPHTAAPSRTAAADPFKPSYGTTAKKELDAIDSFLGKHWTVKVDAKSAGAARTAIEALVKKEGFDVGRFRELGAKKGNEKPAEQLNRAVFAYGVLAGERYGMSQSRDMIGLVNRMREIRSKPPMAGLQEVEPLSFGDALSALTRAMGKAGIKAEPKGWAEYKKTADEYDQPGPESEDFKGKKLHFSLGASIGDFGDTASRASVFYNFVRDRSPLNSMLASVFRQGMNLGVITLEKPIKATLDKAMVDAGMPVIGGRTGDRFDR